MRARFLQRVSAVLLVVATLAACGGREPAAQSSSQWAAGLDRVKSAIAASAGYSGDVLDVTASPTHLRIFVSDAKLSQSDQITRENTASTIVSAAESALSEQAQFVSVQVISVAIIHPAQNAGTAGDSHTEDVLEFRKGSNGRFAHHIT